MSSLGTKLKAYRQKKGLTIQELASDLNEKYPDSQFNKGRISIWERDKGKPNFSSLKTLADYFDISLDYLMGSTENSKRTDVEMDSKSKEMFNYFNDLTSDLSSEEREDFDDSLKDLAIFIKKQIEKKKKEKIL